MTARLPSALFIVVLVLAGVLAYQAVAPVAPIMEPAGIPRPPATALARLPVFAPAPQDRFAIVNARAVFDPARRAVTEPSMAATANTASPPQVTLVGVVSDGTTAVALLLRANGQAVSARTGQSVDGWQITRIAPGLVAFRAGTRDYTVTVRAAAGLAQPPLNSSTPPPPTEKPGQ